MLPYIYLPSKLWTQFQTFLQDDFQDMISCDTFKGSCKFEYPCNEVGKSGTDFNLNVALNDVYDNVATLPINLHEYLKDGKAFSDEGTCYIPIFNNNFREQTEISIGQIFFDKNYVVFDATPSIKNGFYTN